MLEQRYKKAILACRIVTVVSAILSLTLMGILLGSSYEDLRWMDGSRQMVKAVAGILTAGVFLPPFLILYFQTRMKTHQTDAKIEELEREIERLKKR